VTTYDSIRHLLKQAQDEASHQLEAGNVPESDREVVQGFHDDVGRLAERMNLAHGSAPGTGTLGRDLFALMQRCRGPLEQYRRFLEDAISVTKTEPG
jgi:hypothetical protein